MFIVRVVRVKFKIKLVGLGVNVMQKKQHTDCLDYHRIICSGCSNRCYLDVKMKDGKVESLTGDGCRRGIISAKKQLEHNN